MPCPPDDLHLRQQQLEEEEKERKEFDSAEALFSACLPYDDMGGELSVKKLKDSLRFQNKILWIRVYLLQLNPNEKCPEKLRSQLSSEQEISKNYLKMNNYVPRDTVNKDFFMKSPIMLKMEEYERERDIKNSLIDLETVINLSDILITRLPQVPVNTLNLLGWKDKVTGAHIFLDENRNRPLDEIYKQTEIHLCSLRGFLARIYFKYSSSVDTILFDQKFLDQLEKHKKHRDKDRIERIMSIEKMIESAMNHEEKSKGMELRKRLNAIGPEDWLSGADV